jgi:hypothetical protein
MCLTIDHVGLWLSKAYVIPAGMYACQVWDTPFPKSGAEFQTSLQIWASEFIEKYSWCQAFCPKLGSVARACAQIYVGHPECLDRLG